MEQHVAQTAFRNMGTLLRKALRVCAGVVLILILAFIVLVLVVHLVRTPSNVRDWSADQVVLPYADITSDSVTVHRVRNFTYTAEKEYTPQYYDATYSLKDVQSVDFIVEPFAGIGSAHTFLSFGFADGRYLAISVEIRKEKGEIFNPILGLLHSYELMYVAADERDVIALRTLHRKHQVDLYPTIATPEQSRELFVAMLHKMNSLYTQPEFYDTFTNNCTTVIRHQVNELWPNTISWNYRLIFPLNADTFAQELGLLAIEPSAVDIKKSFRVNEFVPDALKSEHFGEYIRTHQNQEGGE